MPSLTPPSVSLSLQKKTHSRSLKKQPLVTTVIPAPPRTSLLEARKHSCDEQIVAQSPGVQLLPITTTGATENEKCCTAAGKSDGNENSFVKTERPADNSEWIPVDEAKVELALPGDTRIPGYMEPTTPPQAAVLPSINSYADEDVRPYSAGSDDSDRETSYHVWRVLGYLAVMNPFLCVFNALYTAAVLILYLMMCPFRLLSSTPKSLRESIVQKLAPQFLLQFNIMFPTSSPHPCAETLHPIKLVLLHLFSPFVAIPFAIAASVVSIMWMYTEVILGERVERRCCEYRAFVCVRQPWERYMFLAVKEKETV